LSAYFTATDLRLPYREGVRRDTRGLRKQKGIIKLKSNAIKSI
jgi:hypothetical protein